MEESTCQTEVKADPQQAEVSSWKIFDISDN